MNGKILQFDDSAHRKADEVLPWFVNGSLEDDERTTVEQHLRECARCRREVELLKQLQWVCTPEDSAQDATPAYLRLRQRIGDGGGLGALKGRLRMLQHPWSCVPPWARWTIAVQLAGILVLGAMLLRPFGDSSVLYHTLGAAATHASRDGAVVVMFVPDVNESESRRILRAAGARPIDGPTQSNAYVVEVPDQRREAILELLRAEPAVTLAQPLTPHADR